MANKIEIGTSGWNYKHWIGNFYPENIKQNNFLKYYSENFCTVEINNTFYKLPEEKNIENWINTTPDDFIFAVKASRYITHINRLKNPQESTALFLSRMKIFKDKLGPILFQFPPNFLFDQEKLKNFISCLPDNYKYAFEFRNFSWFNDSTYGLLKDNNIAFCIYYMGSTQSPEEITSDFVYIRFHGSNTLGSGGYSAEIIHEFSQKISSYQKQGKDVFCYFNNDEAGYAIKNAFKLREFLNLI
jgi:uncharacterized protein YecE (DUF72 family)